MFLAFAIFLFSFQSTANTVTGLDLAESQKRCPANHQGSKKLYTNDYHWDMTREQMADKFSEIYQSGKRLSYHATFDADANQFHLYKNTLLHKVKITPEFIANVAQQIELSLQKGYAEFVFFPDMGHSHLYFPLEYWEQNFKGFAGEKNQLYEKMLADPLLRPLYHTAEQLRMIDDDKNVIDDEYLSFRYWHRNVWASNDGHNLIEIRVLDDDGFNTVRDIPGQHRYGGGFTISASEDGCFGYLDKDGTKRYFDISLFDLELDPATPPDPY